MGCGSTKQLKRVSPQLNASSQNRADAQLDGTSDHHQEIQNGLTGKRSRSFQISNGSDSPDVDATMVDVQTLAEYKRLHPSLAQNFQQLFDDAELLRNLSNRCKDEGALSITKRIMVRFAQQSNEGADSYGTRQEEIYNKLINFFVEIAGAEVLKTLAQRLLEELFIHLLPYRNDSKGDIGLNYVETKRIQTSAEPLEYVLTTLQNIADFHDGFCLACAKAGVIPMCLETARRLGKEFENRENEYEVRNAVAIELTTMSVGILHNLSRRLRDRTLFANCNCEETLLRLAKSEITEIASTALLCLAYLVDEDTNHLILADKTLLEYIIDLIDEALQSGDHRNDDGFSAKELAEGLGHLAINDTNKKVLGEKGAITILVSMLKTSKDDGEKASGTNALWMLAFDEKNKERIKKEEGAMECLRELQQSKNPDVQKAAAGALWELEGKRARSAGKREASGSSGNHVMISYQWDVQEVMIEVKNRLQSSGFKVWMDLEQMGGSTLESMAKAVENSSVVLVCVSLKYKESPNCRSEAEYAYQLRKDIIPLMVQQNYKPDGWLGMIVGTKLWIDFKSKHVIVSGVSKLVKELAGRGKDVDKEDLIDGHQEHAVVRAAVDTAVVSSPVTSSVFSWDTGDVETWLKEIGLDKSCKAIMSNLNGKTLIQLFHLREECPEYYYRCLKEDLLLGSMFNVFKFREELDKRMRT